MSSPIKKGPHALLKLGRSSPPQLGPTRENNSCRKAGSKQCLSREASLPETMAWLSVTHFMEGLSMQRDWQWWMVVFVV